MLDLNQIDFTILPKKKKGISALFELFSNPSLTPSFDISAFANKNGTAILPNNNDMANLAPLSIVESGAGHTVESCMQFPDGSYFYFMTYSMLNGPIRTGNSRQQRWFGAYSFDIPKAYQHILALQRKYISYDYVNRLQVPNTKELTLEGGFSDSFLVNTSTDNPAQALEFLTPEVMYAILDTTLMTSCEVNGSTVTIVCNVLGANQESIQKFLTYCQKLQQKIIY